MRSCWTTCSTRPPARRSWSTARSSAADGFEVDESLLTGRIGPGPQAARRPGALRRRSSRQGRVGTERRRSGPTRTRSRIAQDARRFTLTRSELRDGIDRILLYVTWAIVPTAAAAVRSQYRVHDSWREAVSGAVAGTVAMVPEGLVLLTSLAFAVAVVRLARQRVLVQELPAVEGLARVDVLCIDKTGTLTEGRLGDRARRPRLDETDPAPALAALAAADPAPNATMRALAEAYPAGARRLAAGRRRARSPRRGSGAPRRSAARDVGARRPRRAAGTRRAPRPARRRGRGRQPRAAAGAGRGAPRRGAPRRSSSPSPPSSWPIGSAPTLRRRSRTSPSRASR